MLLRRKIILLAWFSTLFLNIGQAGSTRELSLDDAILLAVRENPNVQTSQLNYILQKFSLEVQQWQFQPHFALGAQKNTSQTYSVTPGGVVTQNSSGVQASASLLTPIGTQIAVTSTNNMGKNYNPGLSLQIEQPLLRGFGKPIVEAALYNAIDGEYIGRLTVENILRNTVTAVLSAYLDFMLAENTVELDQQALQRAKESEQKTKLFIRAGRKAGVELVTVQADVAMAQARIENDKNNLTQVRYALLMTIGLDPHASVHFRHVNIQQLIRRYHIPTLMRTQQMILRNDIQYQIDQITLQGATQRNVDAAEDNTRWALDLTVNASTGNGTGGGPHAGLNSLVNGTNVSDSATLSLKIPLDDRPAKVALASAKIALREAEIALRQEKWQKETNAINSWNTIYSAERAARFAANAAKLQEKTYHISAQKYAFGLIDSLELQSARQQYTAAQQALLNAQINYLRSLINLDSLTGMTLKTWHVNVHS